ncbi:NADH-ubiquinone oxidoreductase-F iron-sulfur binding region domain-containing protein [Nocardioides rubriscoriae]|uniref:NADH-ubiquinone oxidoreductase-F iron-sulfur binding region domain-containing protein n=1 Tax=Nocardioides rubriscoriae TaxID=642762 RepID=UPI0014786BA9|nr:NADH-ubiquinone oxidoreductase-F iron-sulfur binding region domain-containing protein [Nocardioides rubriscoriae]
MAPPEAPLLPPAVALGAARLLLGTSHGQRIDLATHRRLHGTVAPVDLDRLVAMTTEVALLGRGGAAFPVATKLRATPAGSRTQVLVNGSEGEPASFKDRTVMTRTPHLVLDGALAVAGALGTRHVTITVHDDASAHSLRRAVQERRDAGRVRVVQRPGGFVSGEVRAAIRAVDGHAPLPGGRRVLPSVSGVKGAPTFASNVETFAQVAVLLSRGVREHASVGDPDEPGTTLLTLWADDSGPVVVEVPTGLALHGLLPGTDDRPVLVGGYHGTWVPVAGDLRVSRPALRRAGLRLNAGVVARPPADTCLLGEVAAVTRWLAAESAGQCGPCWFGLPALARTVDDLVAGRQVPEAAQARAALLPGRGACAHPDGAAGFVSSALEVLTHEVALHRTHGTCGRPLRGALPVPPVGPRPSARHGGAR